MSQMEPRAHHMRISDVERHQVAEVLREAAGEGRLDMTELDERLDATYAAKTYGELVPITADLPAKQGQPAPESRVRANTVIGNGIRSQQGVAIMSSYERKGDWVVPEKLSVFCLMGGAVIDLTQARFSASTVHLNIVAMMGGAQIKVAQGTRVIIEGVGIMGAFTGPRGESADHEFDPNVPTVRVSGMAIMGGVEVKRRRPRKGWQRNQELP